MYGIMAGCRYSTRWEDEIRQKMLALGFSDMPVDTVPKLSIPVLVNTSVLMPIGVWDAINMPRPRMYLS